MPDKPHVALRWTFCRGLRVEGPAGYVAGTEPRPLPGLLTVGGVAPEHSASVCLRQAVALLTGKAAPGAHKRKWDERKLIDAVGRFLPGYQVKHLNPGAAALPGQVIMLLRRGGVAIAHWHPEGMAPRWTLVTGMEERWAPGIAEPHGLLAMDPCDPPLWCCAHNLYLLPEICGTPPRPGHAWKSRTLNAGLGRGVIGAALGIHPHKG